MKKISMILIELILLSITSGCAKTYTEYQTISYAQLQQMEENNETFPLVIGSSTCSACSMYKVTMEVFIKKYNVAVYFIDLDSLTTEEKDKLRVETNYESTPTTLFYEDGQLLQTYTNIVGAVDMQTLKKEFTTRGYIK